jgi:hypothetical protein
MGRRLSFWVALVAVGTMVGCGGSDGHPDTGYGANQPVPTPETCVDLCQRLADCVVDLCDEDTNSTRYAGAQYLLASSCESTCTDAQVQSAVSSTAWQCMFEDTCRQVFGEDSCHAMSHYNCS